MRIVLIVSVLAALAALETTALAAPTAEDLYAEGKGAYDRTDYATAIARWQASYQLSGESGLLFNLAQALRLSGDCEGALSAYKKFVATASTDSTSEQHKLAEDLVRELEPKCGERSAPVIREGLNGHAHGSGRPGRTLRVAGLVTGGVGVASLAVGLVLGRRASSLADEVTLACSVSCDWAAQKDKHAAGQRDATLGYAIDAIGVAAIAGGAVMYYLGERRSGITVSPRSREGGGMVTWGGSW